MIKPLVLGTGRHRGGDAEAGLQTVARVADRLRELGLEHRVDVGEAPADAYTMVARMRGRDKVVLVDAVISAEPAGHVSRLDSRSAARYGRLSATHGGPLGEAMSWAASTGRLPRDLTLYLIAGERFSIGDQITDDVHKAIAEVAGAIVERELPRLLGKGRAQPSRASLSRGRVITLSHDVPVR